MEIEVKIKASEYEKMQRELSKLHALEAGGVDNWEWYDESLEVWRKENALNELIDNLVCEFGEIVDNMAVDAEVDYPAGRECGYNVNMPRNDIAAKAFINMVISKYKETIGA